MQVCRGGRGGAHSHSVKSTPHDIWLHPVTRASRGDRCRSAGGGGGGRCSLQGRDGGGGGLAGSRCDGMMWRGSAGPGREQV